MNDAIRLGTRASTLAKWQANWVAEQLRMAEVQVELVLITTQGDVKSGPIGNLGGQGVFTKEIQRALLDDRIDLAVHSLKDLPTESIAGLTLSVVPERESTRDVLISRDDCHFAALVDGAHVGTGSMRRRAQLLHARRHLKIGDIRGNVETRLRQLDQGDFDAIVLAEAGLNRLGLSDRITEVFPSSLMLPAVGQGALGLETRVGDERTQQQISCLDDPCTHAGVIAERKLLADLRGGCLALLGAWGRLEGERLILDAVVLDPDGKRRLSVQVAGSYDQAKHVGHDAACQLLDQGAEELIQTARKS